MTFMPIVIAGTLFALFLQELSAKPEKEEKPDKKPKFIIRLEEDS